uniref:Uncharacterized protein n=1 Tax=Arundo donax TaxID=35708 RepID=A0A0A9H749_ARUDO
MEGFCYFMRNLAVAFAYLCVREGSNNPNPWHGLVLSCQIGLRSLLML